MKKHCVRVVGISAILLSTIAFGDEPDVEKHINHSARYGGQFVIHLGDNYHSEIVVRAHEVNVYLFDKNFAPLHPTGVNGTLKVTSPQKVIKEYPLTATETFLKASFESEGLERFEATLTVTLDSKEYATSLKWKKHDHGYIPFKRKIPDHPGKK